MYQQTWISFLFNGSFNDETASSFNVIRLDVIPQRLCSGQNQSLMCKIMFHVPVIRNLDIRLDWVRGIIYLTVQSSRPHVTWQHAAFNFKICPRHFSFSGVKRHITKISTGPLQLYFKRLSCLHFDPFSEKLINSRKKHSQAQPYPRAFGL